MEQKRKIVIPLGGASEGARSARNFDGGATVPAPLFDEEATMGARPVVPLAEASSGGQFRHLPLIALLLLLAIGAGVAGGFAIGVYRSRQNQEAASATTTNPAATSSSEEATAQAPPTAQLPAIASDKSPEPPSRTTAADEAKPPTERSSRDNRSAKNDEQIIPPVEVRERAKEVKREREDKVARNNESDEEREIRREQRRERRRRARENNEIDFNRQIERANQEVNRIREIFEGQRP